MVQASTFVIATLAIVPVIAAPLGVTQASEEVVTRAADTDYLVVREPLRLGKIGGFLKRYGGAAVRNFGKYAVPAARLLLRDENGSLYVREVDLTERDIQDLADLETRNPKIRFGGFFKRLGHVAKFAGGLLLRDVEEGGELEARDSFDIDLSDLTERDFADLEEELITREPRIRAKNIFGTIGRVTRQATRVAGSLGQFASGLGFRDFEDSDELDARDYVDIDELLEREFDLDLEELDAREPRVNVRGALRRASSIGRQATRVASTFANLAGSLGFRELEDDSLDARFDDLD
jgi:hypothetical protein